MVKGTMEFCPACFSHWTSVQVPPSGPADGGWTWQRWQDERPDQPSRRREDRSNTLSQRPKKDKPFKKGKGKGDKNSSKKGDGDAGSSGKGLPDLPSFPPPFANQGFTPFSAASVYASGNAASSPWMQGPAPSKPVESSNMDSELLVAIRKAYPDQSSMPDDIKEVVMKTNAQVGRQLTSEMHRAAAALGKARKALSQVQESQRAHRVRWSQHVAESIDSWKAQLTAFQCQQQNFQAQALQAQKDIQAARTTIQTLNQQAAGAVQVPQEVSELLEVTEPKDFQDPKDVQLRAKMQEILQSCVNFTVESTVPLPAAETPMEDDTSIEKGKDHKRHRSASPQASPKAAAEVPQAGLTSAP